MLAACRPAERVQLERKDGATLRSEVAQGARRDARTTARHQSVRARVGLVERLFEIESHPVVEFVVQRTDRHKTLVLRPRSACYRPMVRCFPSESDGPRGAALSRAPRGLR